MQIKSAYKKLCIFCARARMHVHVLVVCVAWNMQQVKQIFALKEQ